MLASNLLGLLTLPWIWLYNLCKFTWRATSMLKRVIFQGQIQKYIYMAIKPISILPLQRRQKSITVEVLIVNKSLFDFNIKAVTGFATFRLANEYTLPTINSVKPLDIPVNSEATYEINIEGIVEENANLIMKQANAGRIIWHFDLEWQISIPASFRKERIISYSLDYEGVPQCLTLGDIDNI